jgi:outer membrane protein OmpA-like peptidoglycan-associated protein
MKDDPMRRALLLLPLLLCIGSCGSPPKPPTVDESRRHPINSSQAVDLQACRGDLQNTRISASECGRELASTKVWANRVAAHATGQRAQEDRGVDTRNSVYTVLFPFGSSRPMLSPIELARLVEAARGSPWIQLSGRTDGTVESAAESRVARNRAETIRDLLVRNGIDASRIRATWQPVGDPAADMATEGGRSLSRRVEVEVYHSSPRHVSLSAPLAPGDS